MNLVTVEHQTTYLHSEPVGIFPQRMMLRPLTGPDVKILDARLWISPQADVTGGHDIYGNIVEMATFEDRTCRLSIKSAFRVIHAPRSFENIERLARNWSNVPLLGSQAADVEHSSWCRTPDPNGVLESWAQQTARGLDVLEAMTAMSTRIHRDFSYGSRAEMGTQAPVETIRCGKGTCRDFAYLMVESARSLGYGARFVSGYLYNEDSQTCDGNELLGGSSTHAWAQVYIPGAGWVDFDPTNDLVGGKNLIASATVMEPHEASPIIGGYDGYMCNSLGMEVDVAVGCKRMLPQSIYGKTPSIVPAMYR